MAATAAAAPATNGNGSSTKPQHERPPPNPDAVEIVKAAGGKPDATDNTKKLEEISKQIDKVQKEVVSTAAPLCNLDTLSSFFCVPHLLADNLPYSLFSCLARRTRSVPFSQVPVPPRTLPLESDEHSCAPSWTS